MATTSSTDFATEYHAPIMVTEVLDGLNIQPDAWYVDATAGGGGHSQAILQAGGRVICIDQDQEALNAISDRLDHYLSVGQCKLVKANFRDLDQAVTDVSAEPIQGILFDLGVSSHQLDEVTRGFSFKSDNLDMRMDQSLPVTAADLVNKLAVSDLASLIRDLGEERMANRFAQAIDQARQDQAITSAKQLAGVISQASPATYRHGPIHPATRTFQALRLAVNAELDSLHQALPQAVDLLADGGRLVVISFHSLEDRIVKQFINQQPNLRPLTKKPVQATEAEIKRNPRSRSAKLRLAQKEAS